MNKEMPFCMEHWANPASQSELWSDDRCGAERMQEGQ